MPFPTPVLPLIGPLLAAVVLLFLGRWRRVQTAGGVGAALFLAVWTARLPIGGESANQEGMFRGNTWFIAGRPLTITEGLQDLFVFFFIALGLLFLLSFFFDQGRTFVPAGLAAMAPLVAALMVQLTAFAAILLVIAASLLVMTYTPVVRQKTQGSLRYLLLFTLALAPLLLVGWLIESGQAPLYAPLIVIMLTAAVAILLAGFPFYIWVNPIVGEAPFLVPALIFGLAQTAVIVLIFSLLQANPSLQENLQFQNWLTWSGTGTVLIAALLVLTAAKWRFLWGHLLLLNMGMALLTLTLPAQVGGELAVLFHLTRFLSLLLAGSALSYLRHLGMKDDINHSQGFGRNAPFFVALLAYSFFSLLGTPLTIGFPAQWALITAFGQGSNIWLSALLVLAMGISAYRVLRILADMIQGEADEQRPKEVNWQRSIAIVVLAAAILLALFPQPLLNYAKALSAAITS